MFDIFKKKDKAEIIYEKSSYLARSIISSLEYDLKPTDKAEICTEIKRNLKSYFENEISIRESNINVLKGEIWELKEAIEKL